MYWRDHNPAHFHARYGDFEALIRIDWELCRALATPKPIAPLE
jgi:hypothetical protein